MRVTSSWVPLLPPDAVRETDDGAAVAGEWSDGERVREVPGCGDRRAWLVDTVDRSGEDDGERGLSWLLDGARGALAAAATRDVPAPAHGRARRLVGLPALGTGWGGAAG